MTVVTCESCGVTFNREIPAEMRGWLRESLERTPPFCTTCVERLEADDERREREDRGREEAERRRRREAVCGIPEQLRRLTWEHLSGRTRPDVLTAAQRWAQGDLRGLVLAGHVGVGKTWIAAAAAWDRLDRGPLRWFSAPVLMAHLSLPFENELHQRAVLALGDATVGALVLDDVDKIRATEYGAEQLFCAVDNRVTAGKPLLITSNLELGQLATRYPQPHGEAIASRLASYCEAFALEGEDRRLEAWSA